MESDAAQRSQELQQRTMQFAVRIVKLCRVLAKTPGEGWVLQNQLLRSGTSIAANYRAACRARSRQEFAAKLGVVVEETDETIFWLDLLVQAETMSEPSLRPLRNEGQELLRIFASARHTTQKQIRNQKSKINN